MSVFSIGYCSSIVCLLVCNFGKEACLIRRGWCVLFVSKKMNLLTFFVHCGISNQNWRILFAWMDVQRPTMLTVLDSLEVFYSFLVGKIKKKLRCLFWYVVSWTILPHRNEIIFTCAYLDISLVISCIKSLCWGWLGLYNSSSFEVLWED